MTERPILFSAPMVRALLTGSKTQTRRVVKPQPPSIASVKAKAGIDYGWIAPGKAAQPWRVAGPVWAVRELMGQEPQLRCPYGQPGDRLWVREAWADCDKLVRYYADEDVHPLRRKRPSIHMPRWASRITLEVTGVRVEQLQDISRGEAMAEGCPFPNMSHGDDPRRWYADLWEQINGDGSWEANPWVWVVEFKKIGGAA